MTGSERTCARIGVPSAGVPAVARLFKNTGLSVMRALKYMPSASKAKLSRNGTRHPQPSIWSSGNDATHSMAPVAITAPVGAPIAAALLA